ncbi:Hypothetical protein A7982_00001 [Minicystis rosea]|nr:Hypothetical protein A7982_00001 [Minicystis rosea]
MGYMPPFEDLITTAAEPSTPSPAMINWETGRLIPAWFGLDFANPFALATRSRAGGARARRQQSPSMRDGA